MDSRLFVAVAIVAVVVVYAVLSGYWTSREPGWYESLPRPSWQPPDIVFAIIWPLSFLALGTVGWVMGYTQQRVAAITFGVVLTCSAVFSLGWAYLFYVPHRLGLAAASLTAASASTWILVVVTFDTVIWAGVVLLPYAVWLTLATSLAYGYAHLVPPQQRHRSRREREGAAES